MIEIINRIKYINGLLTIQEEIENRNFNTFVEYVTTKKDFRKKQNKIITSRYTTYRVQKLLPNQRKLYDIRFFIPKGKLTFGTDEFYDFIEEKWEKLQKKKKINLDELRKEQIKWNELYTTLSNIKKLPHENI
jgi:hypothetical protein